MPLYNAKRWTILVQVSFMTINTILLLNLCLAFMADYQERLENEAHDWFSQMRHVMLNDAFDLFAKIGSGQPPDDRDRLRNSECEVEGATSSDIASVLHETFTCFGRKPAQQSGETLLLDRCCKAESFGPRAPPVPRRLAALDVVILLAQLSVVADLNSTAADRLNRQHRSVRRR